MPKIRLIEHRPLSRRATQFSFHAPFRHGAGQYVALRAEVGGTLLQRYYSIASPPRPDGIIELCIHHEGKFGRYLLGLKSGDAIDCSEPRGRCDSWIPTGLRSISRQVRVSHRYAQSSWHTYRQIRRRTPRLF